MIYIFIYISPLSIPHPEANVKRSGGNLSVKYLCTMSMAHILLLGAIYGILYIESEERAKTISKKMSAKELTRAYQSVIIIL